MRKKVFSFILAAAMVLAMPAALFASDTLVTPEGEPVSNDVFDNGWTKATPTDVIELAAAEALAVVTPTAEVEVEEGDAGEFRTVKVDSSSVGTNRISSTSGSVSAYAAFDKTATKATCTIILQVKSGSSWITATDLSVYSYVKTVNNANSISAGKTFTLKSGKVYRAKIVFTDTNSSGTYTMTRYTGSF